MWARSLRNLHHSSRCFQTKLPPKEATLAKFDFPLASHTVKSLLSHSQPSEKSITIYGHINRKPRILAARTFAELRDENGDTIQLLLDPLVTGAKIFDELKKTGAEDSVCVSGVVQHRGNDTLQFEIVVSSFQTLNHSNLDAARLDRLKHSNPADIPPQFRYLQLRTAFYQNALRKRSHIASVVRKTLISNHGFTEVETPLLFKSTPEGAREFLVPTRSPDRFYALPQSPQQYKQILMSSGFTRYFQVARCFRDEDLRADRQPEFTQIDLEMSYINNSDQVGTVIEDVVTNVLSELDHKAYTLNENGYLEPYSNTNSLSFRKLKYVDALRRFGIDKPDVRSNIEFLELSSHFEGPNSEFSVVEACVLKNVFDPSAPYKVPKALSDSHNYSKRRPVVLAIKTEEEAQSWYVKYAEKGLIKKVTTFDENALRSSLNVQPGDVVAFSTRSQLPYENPTPLGKFRQLAIQHFPGQWKRPIVKDNEVTSDYDESRIFVGNWVIDFPLFNPVEISSDSEYPEYDFNRLESTHHPFTMAKTEDYDLLASDPLKVRGEHYDLVINGVEVGGGSRRIHDFELQKYVFEQILKIQNYNDLFGHLLHALSMGCPPHAGIALGFDRFCAMMIGSNNIRDVIAFPKNQSGVDAVVESPTSVKEETLAEYYIKTVNSCK